MEKTAQFLKLLDSQHNNRIPKIKKKFDNREYAIPKLLCHRIFNIPIKRINLWNLIYEEIQKIFSLILLIHLPAGGLNTNDYFTLIPIQVRGEFYPFIMGKKKKSLSVFYKLEKEIGEYKLANIISFFYNTDESILIKDYIQLYFFKKKKMYK